MTKLNLVLLSLFFVMTAKAQESTPADSSLATEVPVGTEQGAPAPTLTKPKGRQKQKNNLQPGESSSFMGDAENIDPLNPNRDNIKDDNEPVLDDIKDVLNADLSQKTNGVSGDPTATPSDATTDGATNAAGGGASAGSNLVSDDPDLELEKKFHNIYQRYNKNPTPNDAWAAASSKQTARLYEVQKGDTLWSISQVLFGDPNFWPKLWAINKQGILNPHFINPKMKIYFYQGDENNSPTLSIGQQAPLKPGSAGIAELGLKGDDDDEGSGAARVNELQPVNEALRVARRPVQPVPTLPDSLPVGRNLRFHGAKLGGGIRIDLAQPKPNVITFKNNVIVSDSVIKGDIELKPESGYRSACSAGRAFGNMTLNNGPLEGEYEIFEHLDGFESIAGHKEVYRQIGTAEAYKGNLLKVIECVGVNSEFLVMKKGRIKEFATTQVTEEPQARIVGGPDYGNRNFFGLLQFAFVDFGQRSFDVGASYASISSDTASPNGQFSVIEKYGSFALVVFTSVSDLIELGDRVATAEDMAAAPMPPATTAPAVQPEEALPAAAPSTSAPDLELEL